MSELKNASDQAKETVKDASKEVTDNTMSLAETLKEKAYEIGNNIKDGATDLGKDGLAKTKLLHEHAVEYISDNPYTAVGIAFLLGIACVKYRKMTRKW